MKVAECQAQLIFWRCNYFWQIESVGCSASIRFQPLLTSCRAWHFWGSLEIVITVTALIVSNNSVNPLKLNYITDNRKVVLGTNEASVMWYHKTKTKISRTSKCSFQFRCKTHIQTHIDANCSCWALKMKCWSLNSLKQIDTDRHFMMVHF